MYFITFMYRIGYGMADNTRTYFGKYCFYYISDDHEGLDKEIKPDLIKAINLDRKERKLPEVEEDEVTLGILACCTSNYIPNYSSDAERNFYDFYYERTDYGRKPIMYLKGKVVQTPP
jgi:hypothetical protein